MRALLTAPGRAQRAVLAIACAVVVVMFWTNDDHAGVPDAPRGTGQYLPVLARGDGHMLYPMTLSTAFDLDWTFDNELAAFGDPWYQPRNADGHKQIPHPVGPALVWTPVLWVAHAGAHVANALGAAVPLHGYTEWHQRTVFLTSVLAALLAIRIGNPFQFPANAYFALAHDVELNRWDHAVGYYALVPPAHTLRDDSMYLERGAWRIGYPRAEPYLVGEWSASQMGAGQAFRWTVSPSVTVLVPNLMPYPQRFTLWLAPGGAREITVRWDGEVVARGTLVEGWQTIVFDVYDLDVGEHELTIDAVPGPFAGTHEWPSSRQPVGVAVSLLELGFIRP